MTTPGFQLTSLTLTGHSVDPATLTFGAGLNVISGPSDTGKTFIAECIDYAFGWSQRPSDIPEAAGYETVALGLKALDSGVEYVVERSLQGGGAKVSAAGQPDRILAEKHDPKSAETISAFLLNLCGLDGRLVRTNAQGKTRQLSFRDLAQLIVVSEQDIIKKLSPVRSGQNTDKTVEDSVFRLLLTGVDDGSVVAEPDKAIVSAESRGKAELLELLLEQARSNLGVLAPRSTQAELVDQLARLDASVAEAMATLASEQGAATALEARRKAVWESLREGQSRHAVLSELQGRFTLLSAQYESDLLRLETIAEAGVRLSQLDESRCPVCGAEAKYHSDEHPDHAVAPEAVALACAAEAARLRVLVRDLGQTSDQNAAEVRALSDAIEAQKGEMYAADEELKTFFKPRLNDVLTRLREVRETQTRVRQALDICSRINELEALQSRLDKSSPVASKSKYAAAAGSSVTEQLALKIEELLRVWEFPGLQRVTFSDADQDILISGRKRAAFGKGVRAITHAAFTIGLLHYCLDNRLPHPSVIVIDSPLVVYRDPDTEEVGFSRKLKDLVYTTLAAQSERGQIILLENEDPPDGLPATATIIRFTGAAHGRKGFIPQPRARTNNEG